MAGGGVQPHFCPWEKSIWKEREMNTFPSFSHFPHGEKWEKTYFSHGQKWGWTPPPHGYPFNCGCIVTLSGIAPMLLYVIYRLLNVI